MKKECAAIQAQFGTISILVNNAAIVQGKRIWELSEEEINKTIDVNLKGTIWVTRFGVPHCFLQCLETDTPLPLPPLLQSCPSRDDENWPWAHCKHVIFHGFCRDRLSSSSCRIFQFARDSLCSSPPTVKLADYCASKSGVYTFNESLRMELREAKASGIKTTVVCPGLQAFFFSFFFLFPSYRRFHH